MMKINLLGVAPPRSKISSMGGPPAQKATKVMMCAGALIICFGIVGVIYEIWSNQITNLEKARAREKIRQNELAMVKSQNARYQQRLKDLETRINTIQALQSSRVGPVELMSALGLVVNKTKDVYLYTMTPAGERLTLKGQSNTVDSLSVFLASLNHSGFFDGVQLEQFYQDDQHDRPAYKFAVSCQFKSPTGGTLPSAGGAVAAGGPNLPAGPQAPAAQTPAHARMLQ